MMNDRLMTTRLARFRGRQRYQDGQEARERSAPAASLDPRSTFSLSVWFGLVVGLVELGLKFALKPLSDPSPGFFRMNRHIVWTIPTVNFLLFTTCGLLLVLAVRVRPRCPLRFIAIVPSVLAMLTLLLTVKRLYAWACVVLACGLGYRLALRIEANAPAFQRMVRRSFCVLGIVVFGLVGISLGGHVLRERWAMELLLPVTSNGPDAPNVLLIVLDTVRADRLSLYGYGRDTTPNLARLARRGVRFEQARSTAPWTLPSHVSMMTGQWPHQVSAGLHGPLDATHPTLAEFLAANGYATGGFVANQTYCSGETGLGRGFAHYDDHDLTPRGVLCTSALGRRILWQGLSNVGQWLGGQPWPEFRKDAARMNRDLLAWIDQQSDHPFFAFVNYFDAHNPYVLPAGFDRHFGVKPQSSADDTVLDRWFISDKKTLTPREIRLVNDAYDDCIAYLDHQLGLLFDRLEKSGRLDKTLIIVTADHGEHFGEHQLYGHASSLYDPEIRVPLLALLPGGACAGQTVSEPVSLRDLPATIADLLRLAGASPFPGRSLARCWLPSASGEHEPTLAEVDAPVKTAPNQGRSPVFRGAMKALVLGGEIYIHNGDGVEEIYDLASDPAQTRNLAGSPEAQSRLGLFRKTLDRLTVDDTRPPEWRGIVAKTEPDHDPRK